MKRRAALQGLGLAPFALTIAGTAQARSAARLTVGELEVFRLRVNKRGNWTIARLKTANGLTGLGDATQSSRDEETLLYLKQFAAVLKDRSIFDVEWFRKQVAPVIEQNPGSRANIAASALEQCLWDLQGKALSVPTYELLGGRIQDHLRVYANINRSTDPRTPEGFARMAERAIRDGFDAIKLAPFDDMPHHLTDAAAIEKGKQFGLDCAQAVRQAIGPDRDVLIDAHSQFSLSDAVDLAKRFDPLQLYWLEEVTPATPPQNLAALTRVAPMPIAGGESIQGVKGFYPYIKAEAVDIVMPDVKVCGGMLEMKKIAALAEGAGLMTSPHGPASPIGNVAAAHVMATVPNFEIFELSYGEVPWRAELIDPPEQIRDSAITLSDKPGLGITLNEKTIAKYAL
jgi:galactonate dehydratase